MWLTTINGKEEKMEDISRCFIWFPRFRKDFPILFEEGIIKHIAFDQYEWTESDTSLAEYFRELVFGNERRRITGGRWGPIAKTFNKDRRSLSRLASSNGNDAKPEYSEGFRRVKKIVLQYSEKIRQQIIHEKELEIQ